MGTQKDKTEIIFGKDYREWPQIEEINGLSWGNEILNNTEKTGGRERSETNFQDFRQMVQVCNFTDLHTVGNIFSWAGQRGTHYVSCCLDRTMANESWHASFPTSEINFL